MGDNLVAPQVGRIQQANFDGSGQHVRVKQRVLSITVSETPDGPDGGKNKALAYEK